MWLLSEKGYRAGCSAGILAIMFLMFLSGSLEARRYELKDWVSYGVFRHVTSMAIDDTYIYFGTTGGVTRFDHWKERWDTPLTTSSGLIDNYVLGVAVDEDNHEVVFKTRRGICRYDAMLESFRIGGSFPTLPASPDMKLPDLYPDDFGLNFYSEDWGAYLTDPYLRRFPVTAHLADAWGNLWIGTLGLGAGRASIRSGRLKMLPYGLMERNIMAMAFDDQYLWLGGIDILSDAPGITRVSKDMQSWDYFEARYLGKLRSDDVTSFAVGEDAVWVGSLYGLSRYDKLSEDWATYTTFEGLNDDWVTDTVLDQGIVWVGTAHGANTVSVRNDSILIDEISGIGRQKVYDIEADSEFIWFGTDNGVYALDKVFGRWSKFTSPDGTIEGIVTAISSFSDEIWFGTSVGLSVYQRSTQEWQWHPIYQQLQAGHIICLEAEEKAVWAGTETGLWKLRRQTGRWRAFTTEDGLADNIVQAILLDGEYIWLGTPQGATRFYWDDPLRID